MLLLVLLLLLAAALLLQLPLKLTRIHGRWRRLAVAPPPLLLVLLPSCPSFVWTPARHFD